MHRTTTRRQARGTDRCPQCVVNVDVAVGRVRRDRGTRQFQCRRVADPRGRVQIDRRRCDQSRPIDRTGDRRGERARPDRRGRRQCQAASGLNGDIVVGRVDPHRVDRAHRQVIGIAIADGSSGVGRQIRHRIARIGQRIRPRTQQFQARCRQRFRLCHGSGVKRRVTTSREPSRVNCADCEARVVLKQHCPRAAGQRRDGVILCVQSVDASSSQQFQTRRCDHTRLRHRACGRKCRIASGIDSGNGETRIVLERQCGQG